MEAKKENAKMKIEREREREREREIVRGEAR